MGEQTQNNLAVRHRNLGLTAVSDYEPILVRSRLQTMENFSPREFALSGKVQRNHPFMKSPSIGIVWSVRLIKLVLVRQQHNLNTVSIRRKCFHLEDPMFRNMKTKNMPLPVL